MGYCFMHIEKIKSFGKMASAYKHNLRVMQPANADPNKADLNDELIPLDGQTYKNKWDERVNDAYATGAMTKNLRSDAVLGLEVLLTFSKSDIENVDIEKWKKDNIEWLNKTFNIPGSAHNNVVSAMYHGDENGNVHIHAFVVPMDDKGKLNASYFIGSPMKMKKMQNEYAAEMKKDHGLQRGLEGSVAKHEDIKKFYTKLNQTFDVSQVPKPEPEEEIELYYGRVCKYVQDCNMVNFQKEKQIERTVVELQTDFQQELSGYRKEKKELRKKEKKLKELLGNAKKYGKENDLSPNELEKRLKAFAALQNGLKNMKDQDHAEELRKEINGLIQTQRNREKSLEKEYEQKWDI